MCHSACGRSHSVCGRGKMSCLGRYKMEWGLWWRNIPFHSLYKKNCISREVQLKEKGDSCKICCSVNPPCGMAFRICFPVVFWAWQNLLHYPPNTTAHRITGITLLSLFHRFICRIRDFRLYSHRYLFIVWVSEDSWLLGNQAVMFKTIPRQQESPNGLPVGYIYLLSEPFSELQRPGLYQIPDHAGCLTRV